VKLIGLILRVYGPGKWTPDYHTFAGALHPLEFARHDDEVCANPSRQLHSRAAEDHMASHALHLGRDLEGIALNPLYLRSNVSTLYDCLRP
jgi:hypothetical protein